MHVKVHDLMTPSTLTTQRHKTVEHVRNMMEKHSIGSVPIVDTDDHPIGIVSTIDLLGEVNPSSPISTVMTEKVYTIPQYDDVAIAARVMRNHKIHHVVVTHENRVVGMLSSFDLLQLVENHRFVAKNAPTPPRRRKSRKV